MVVTARRSLMVSAKKWAVAKAIDANGLGLSQILNLQMVTRLPADVMLIELLWQP